MREALFQAILKAPWDDAPRLVYADWLDEQGEHEHAELIRLQVEETLGFGPSARSTELLRCLKGQIAGELGKHGVLTWKIRRGWLDELSIGRQIYAFESLLEALPEAIGQHPLLSLRIESMLLRGVPTSRPTALMTRFASQPWTAHLTRLSFTRILPGKIDQDEEDPLRALLQGQWTSLRELTLTYLPGYGPRAPELEREVVHEDLQQLPVSRLPALECVRVWRTVLEALPEVEGVEVIPELLPE